MCWRSSKPAIKKIATQDILVYKVMDKDLKSKYYRYPYTIGKVNTIDRELVVKHHAEYIIEEGFHSIPKIDYIAPSKVSCQSVWIYNCGVIEVIDIKREALFECIIPKGSTYYLNEDNYAVSNSIIIKRKISCTKFMAISNQIEYYYNKLKSKFIS